LIAPALLARGVAVSEIMSGVPTQPHALTPGALVNNNHVTYPGATDTRISGNAGLIRSVTLIGVSSPFENQLPRTAVQKKTVWRREPTDH
jgi:hypothetical protein